MFCAVLAGGLLSGCREAMEVDEFRPALTLLNRDASVQTGESLRFRIDSNHDRYFLEGIYVDSRLEGDFPATGRLYDAGQEFSIPVTVRATHRGSLAVQVRDTQTDRRVTLDTQYRAYSIAEFSMTVLTAAVSDGDDFAVRVSCTHDAFELMDVECPFVFDGYRPGRAYAVGAAGYVDLVARSVSVTASGSASVKLTVRDTESRQVVRLEGTFEMRRPTQVSLVLVDEQGNPKSVIRDRETFYLRVYDSQESFQVEDFYCEFGNLLNKGATYRVSSDGFYQVAARDVRVTENHGGTVYLDLFDPVHGKTHRLSYDYSAVVSQ